MVRNDDKISKVIVSIHALLYHNSSPLSPSSAMIYRGFMEEWSIISSQIDELVIGLAPR